MESRKKSRAWSRSSVISLQRCQGGVLKLLMQSRRLRFRRKTRREGDPVLVVIDADNTLWDTNEVYARAQLQLLARVEKRVAAAAKSQDPLAFVRAIDQRVASELGGNLRYPPDLLVRGLASALNPSFHLSPEECEADAREFVKELGAVPELRPGVREGLADLGAAGAQIIVATESDRSRCEELLRRWELLGFINELIAGKKSPEFFRAIRAKWAPRNNAFVLGDQIDRDVEFGKIAGFTTVFVPGGFVPSWTLTNATKPDYIASTFREAAHTIVAIVRRALDR